MQAARIQGIHLHYLATGPEDAPALVFSNSLGTDFRIWQALLPRLAGDLRIVLYDKRGHGLSDTPPAPYRLDDHVSDLIGLLDHLDVGQAIVCGLSVGGLIAQGLAARQPERVRAMVLCDTAQKIGNDELWNGRIETGRRDGIEALADGILERWFSARFRAERAAEVRLWRNMLVRTPPDGYLGTCAAIRDTDYTKSSAEIRVPTLALAGSEDGATPPSVVRGLAELIPGARFREIPESGHLPCIDAPDVLAKVMNDFFAEHGLV